MRRTKRPVIAVLGATGALGGNVCHLLAHMLDVSILACGRDTDRLAALASQLGDKHRTLAMDLHAPSPEVLERLAECTVAINCTGPSWKLCRDAADAALQGQTHYVDCGGYTLLAEHVAPHHERFVHEGRSCIIGAGWMPGFAETVARRLVESAETHYGESVRSLDLFFGARDVWPTSSVSDMIWHLFELPHSLGWFEHGVWHKAPLWNMGAKVTLPCLSTPQRVAWVYNEPFANLAQEHPAMRLRAGMLFLSPRTQAIITYIKTFLRNDREQATRLLQQAIAHDTKHHGTEGLVFGQAITTAHRKLSCLIRSQDNMPMTALAAVQAARSILQGSAQAGVLYFDQAVPSQEVMAELTRLSAPADAPASQGNAPLPRMMIMDAHEEQAVDLQPAIQPRKDTISKADGQDNSVHSHKTSPLLRTILRDPARATAILDLCSRAHGSQQAEPWLRDPAAQFFQVMTGTPQPWSTLHPLTWMGVCARTRLLDSLLSAKLTEWQAEPHVSVWLLGAGFDGRWARLPLLQRQGVFIHEWDDATLLDLKRQMLAQSPWTEIYNRVEAHPWSVVASDTETPPQWERALREAAAQESGQVIIVMEGLLDLLPQPLKSRLLTVLAEALPHAVLLADALNDAAARYDNKHPERYTGSPELRVHGLGQDPGNTLLQAGWITTHTESVFGHLPACPLKGCWKGLRLFPMPQAMLQNYCCRMAIPVTPLQEHLEKDLEGQLV